MSSLFHVLVIPFLILGLLVNTLGVVSLFRFKDVYMRMHGATKCSTLGTLFCALGVIVYALIRLVSGGEARFAVLVIHVIAAVFGLLIANSTGAHVLRRTALAFVLNMPWLMISTPSARKNFRKKTLQRRKRRNNPWIICMFLCFCSWS